MTTTPTRYCPACNCVAKGAKRKQPVLSPMVRRFVPARQHGPGEPWYVGPVSSAYRESHIEWRCERCGFREIEDAP